MLASHPKVAKVGLIGSVATGRAVMRGAADTIKDVILELGGKNAVIVCADADVEKAARGVVAGMNFAWCGQSCGSTSRAFLHADIHDAVVERVRALAATFKPGDPTHFATTMGALISRQQHKRVLDYIATARREGARLVCGGKVPDDPALRNGFFIEPTVFADVTPDMTIAREEIFGPVLAVLRWQDEAVMMAEVNRLDYGLTCSIWTRDLRAGAPACKPGRCRLRLGQQGGTALPRRAVRRRQAFGYRPRGVSRGTLELHPREEHPHRIRLSVDSTERGAQRRAERRQMDLRVRRVVTGHDAQGRATVISDGPTHKPTSSRPGQQSVVIWATDGVPADNGGNADAAAQPVATALKNGTALRVIEYQPGVAGRTHRTHSVDYAIILSGSVDLLLDDGKEVHLKAGDIVVQRGTVHDWQNRGDVPCRIAFVWIAAQPVEIAGKRLDAFG